MNLKQTFSSLHVLQILKEKTPEPDEGSFRNSFEFVYRYFQNFDLEGESGIVVRAIGTAVSLARLQMGQPSPAVLPSSISPGKE